MGGLCGLDSVPRLIESHDGQNKVVSCDQENLGKDERGREEKKRKTEGEQDD
jgi:hypothetical protein